MHVIYWLVLILGISIVGMGLAFANTYIRNEELKNDMIDKAYIWKAKQEKIATQQEEGCITKRKNEELSQVRVTAGRKFKPSHSEQ